MSHIGDFAQMLPILKAIPLVLLFLSFFSVFNCSLALPAVPDSRNGSTSTPIFVTSASPSATNSASNVDLQREYRTERTRFSDGKPIYSSLGGNSDERSWYNGTRCTENDCSCGHFTRTRAFESFLPFPLSLSLSLALFPSVPCQELTLRRLIDVDGR